MDAWTPWQEAQTPPAQTPVRSEADETSAGWQASWTDWWQTFWEGRGPTEEWMPMAPAAQPASGDGAN